MANTRIIPLVKTFKREFSWFWDYWLNTAAPFSLSWASPSLPDRYPDGLARVATRIALRQHSGKGQIKNIFGSGEFSFSSTPHIWKKLWKSFVHSKGKTKNTKQSLLPDWATVKRDGVLHQALKNTEHLLTEGKQDTCVAVLSKWHRRQKRHHETLDIKEQQGLHGVVI